MKLNGKIIKGTVVLRDETVEIVDHTLDYRSLLEKCLVELCKTMGIAVPMWLQKNTKEYVRYRKTWFTDEQFLEPVNFDRLDIRCLE